MSNKPVAERLQVKDERRLAVIDAPAGLDALVGALDARADAAEAEVALLFVADRAALDAQLPRLIARTRPGTILWVAYPKLSSKLAGDLNRDVIHDAAPGFGLTPVAQIAIDADWSALRVKRV